MIGNALEIYQLGNGDDGLGGIDPLDLINLLASTKHLTLYEEVAFAGTNTGAVTVTANTVIDTDHFGTEGRVVLSETLLGKPTNVTPKNPSGQIITGSIDSLGNITLSENYTGNLAIIHGIDVSQNDYSALSATVTNRILDATDGDIITSKNVIDNSTVGGPTSEDSFDTLKSQADNTDTDVTNLASSLSAVATSGDYNDLSNTPQNLSDFTNDAGFITTNTTSSFTDNVNGTITHDNGDGNITIIDRFQELIITNTDITTNIANILEQPFDEMFGAAQNDDSTFFTVDLGTATITFQRAGRISVDAAISMEGGLATNSARNNIKVSFFNALNVEVSPPFQSNYLRDGSGHNNVTQVIAGWPLDVAIGDSIQLRRSRLSGSGGQQQLDGTNNFLKITKVR